MGPFHNAFMVSRVTIKNVLDLREVRIEAGVLLSLFGVVFSRLVVYLTFVPPVPIWVYVQ